MQLFVILEVGGSYDRVGLRDFIRHARDGLRHWRATKLAGADCLGLEVFGQRFVYDRVLRGLGKNPLRLGWSVKTCPWVPFKECIACPGHIPTVVKVLFLGHFTRPVVGPL